MILGSCFKLSEGCPKEPAWKGANTDYSNLAGEPFSVVPTYYKIEYCPGDNTWRTIYYVYFKKLLFLALLQYAGCIFSV